MSPEFLPLIAAAPLLVAMAFGDFRWMRIPNALVLTMLALFALSAPFTLTLEEVTIRVIVAAVVFLLGFAAFAFNVMAGGDVKGLAALMLFVPTAQLATFGFTFSFAMLVGMGFALGLRHAFGSPDSRFVSLATKKGYPMGVSIALAGLLLPFTAAL